MNKFIERIYNGLVKENPTFVLMLGMCPTLAVTSSAFNGMGMGLTTTVVLIMANAMIAALRKLIPDKVRIPAFIVVVATFVTIIQRLLEGYVPALYDALGIYIPLIVVNCIILGRAEAYASKNNILLSIGDGIGMGLGFTVGLSLIGIFREIIGTGMVFGVQLMPKSYEPVTIFVLAPGAFFVLAMLTAIQNKLKLKSATNGGSKGNLACGGNCSGCVGSDCVANRDLIESQMTAEKGQKMEKKEGTK